MDRLLPYEWRKAVDLTGGQENVRRWHTSDLNPRPPAGPIDGADEYGLIRRWMTAVACALEDPERVRGWGGRAIAVRLVLLALGQAAMVSGSSVLEFGMPEPGPARGPEPPDGRPRAASCSGTSPIR